jgi:hypothetical protein
MKILSFLLISHLLISTNAFAHGEDKYGPNKGYIRMPGSFHSELVPQSDGAFLVFLLDLQNKNPTLKDSSVELKLKDSKNTIVFKCTPMEDHFMCSNDKKVDINASGQLILKSKRLGIQARDAIYDLPLKLKNAKGNEEHDMNKMDMKK